MLNAAAFVRLCVETIAKFLARWNQLAAAFVRLCVETKAAFSSFSFRSCSRLRAAVC